MWHFYCRPSTGKRSECVCGVSVSVCALKNEGNSGKYEAACPGRKETTCRRSRWHLQLSSFFRNRFQDEKLGTAVANVYLHNCPPHLMISVVSHLLHLVNASDVIVFPSQHSSTIPYPKISCSDLHVKISGQTPFLPVKILKQSENNKCLLKWCQENDSSIHI